jgi:DNA adenine methylase
MKTIRPVFKCHGGKFYLAKWIISLFPESHTEMVYVEPYCGGANVLLNKPKGGTEVINDLDLGVVQIYRALRDEPKEFVRRLNLCKYSQDTFERALARSQFEDYIDHAVNEFIVRRMSRGGLRKKFAWSERLRGGQPGDVNAWKTALKGLPELAERLKSVYIFNRDAAEVIQAFNNKNTLLYCDPPYLHETRVSKTVYSSEMTTDDHIQLAHLLNNFEGKALISGYMSPLYNRLYKNWNVEKKSIANHSSQQRSKQKKVEVVWKNF